LRDCQHFASPADFFAILDPIGPREATMQGWRLGFQGIETIPSWLGEFEVEQFFRLSPSEIATVKTRRGKDMQLGLSLHIGCLRMSGRVLNSTDVIHWCIPAFLGASCKFPLRA
jgi:Domain of unknown function (DUF4158)